MSLRRSPGWRNTPTEYKAKEEGGGVSGGILLHRLQLCSRDDIWKDALRHRTSEATSRIQFYRRGNAAVTQVKTGGTLGRANEKSGASTAPMAEAVEAEHIATSSRRMDSLKSQYCSRFNSQNQVRGHRTGFSHSGAEQNPREK